jgi:hypothetical protein
VSTQGMDEQERKWLLQYKCISAGQNMYHYRSRYIELYQMRLGIFLAVSLLLRETNGLVGRDWLCIAPRRINERDFLTIDSPSTNKNFACTRLSCTQARVKTGA